MTNAEGATSKSAWELQQDELLADLMERCAIQPEIRAALSVAWRLGYNRCVMDGPMAHPYMVTNPFWSIPSLGVRNEF